MYVSPSAVKQEFDKGSRGTTARESRLVMPVNNKLVSSEIMEQKDRADSRDRDEHMLDTLAESKDIENYLKK